MAERQQPEPISEISALEAIKKATANICDATDLIDKVSEKFTVDDNRLLEKRIERLRKFVEQGDSISGKSVRDFSDAIHNLDEALREADPTGIPAEIKLTPLGLSAQDLAESIHSRPDTVSGDLNQLQADLRDLVTNISQIQYEEFRDGLRILTSNLTSATRYQIDHLLDLEESLRETLKLSCTENTALRQLKELFDKNLEDPSMNGHSLKRRLSILSNRLGDMVNVVRNRDVDIDDIKGQTTQLAIQLLEIRKDHSVSNPHPHPPPSNLDRDPENYVEMAKNVTAQINYLRGWMADNPPGTGVAKGNRLNGSNLAKLQDELNGLNLGIAIILAKEDPLFPPKNGPLPKRVRFEYADGTSPKSKAEILKNLIISLKDLNTALHQLSTLIVNQYPDVVNQPGGIRKLGHQVVLDEIKREYTDTYLESFEASNILKLLHQHGYLNASNCKETNNELRFTFAENRKLSGREVIGSAPSKSYWDLRATAVSIVTPVLAAGAFFSGLAPELAAPILAIQLPVAWFMREAHKAALQSRFDVTITRDAEGNALKPEDIVARCICVAKAMSRIAHQVGSLNPAAEISADQTTRKLTDPFRVLLGQSIKALSIAVENFDKLGSNDPVAAANARAPVEQALADIVKYKDLTMNAWNRYLSLPMLPMYALGSIGSVLSFGRLLSLFL